MQDGDVKVGVNMVRVIRKHYRDRGVRTVSIDECVDEVRNLMRKKEKGNLNDSQFGLASELGSLWSEEE